MRDVLIDRVIQHHIDKTQRGRHLAVLFVCLMALLMAPPTQALAASFRVVTVTTDHAWLAKQLGGKRVVVSHFLTGREDPHHASARPSLILLTSNAKLFVSPGMELDVGYTPLILRNSRNANVQMGGKGFVDGSVYVKRQQIMANVNRAMGDQHPQGNPHYQLDPVAMIDSARAVLAGLVRVDPAGRSFYLKRFKRLRKQMLERIVGKILVQAAGTKRLMNMLRTYKLIPFLRKTHIGGKPLLRYLGGWMKKMMPLRGKRVLSYHRQWVYFFRRFGIRSIGQIEPKPGIPPSAQHLNKIIGECKANKPKLLVSALFFAAGSAQFVAKKTALPLLRVPVHTGGAPSANTYPKLIDHLVDQFASAK